jgi:ribosomal protein S26
MKQIYNKREAEGHNGWVRCAWCGSRLPPKALFRLRNGKMYCNSCLRSWKEHLSKK